MDFFYIAHYEVSLFEHDIVLGTKRLMNYLAQNRFDFPLGPKESWTLWEGNKLSNVSYLSKVMMESGSGRDCSEMQFPFYILMHFAFESRI